MSYTTRFDQLGRDDVDAAGGKGANLGELVRAGLPVPAGFVLTTAAYREFVQTSGIGAEILTLAAVPADAGPAAYDEPSARIRAGIRQLREAGYLRQERGHDEVTGQFVWRWEITDDPAAFAQVSPSDGFSVDGEQEPDPEPETSRSAPVTGFPSMAEPSMVNPSTATTYLEELTPHLSPPPVPPDPATADPVVVEARAVLDRVNAAAPRGRMGRHQLAKLTPSVVSVLQAGIWTAPTLSEHLADNLAGIKSAYSVTRYRLADLPDAPLAVTPARPARPPWCGTCDEHTRHRENVEGKAYRCPACHPLTGAQRRQEETTACPA